MPRLALGLNRDNTRIFFGMFFNEGAFGMYQTLWPLYIAALGATPPQIGLVIGTLGLVRLVALFVSAPLGERIPPRRLIVTSRALSALGMFSLVTAQQWWHLLPAVVILAAGSAGFPMISNVIADGVANGPQRSRAFSLIFAVGPSIALLITPALGGLIAQEISLRGVFFFAALLISGSVFAFSRIGSRPIMHTEGPPVTYRSALAYRPILLLCLLQLTTIFNLTLGMTLMPNFLRDSYGVELSSLGWLASIGAAGGIVLGLAVNRISLFHDPFLAITLAVLMVTGSLVLFLAGGHIVVLIVAFLLRGAHFIAWTLFAAANSRIPPDRLRPRAFSLAETMGGIGMSSAPFVAGWLYDINPAAPLVSSVVLTAPLLVGLTWIRRAVREQQPAAEFAGGTA